MVVFKAPMPAQGDEVGVPKAFLDILYKSIKGNPSIALLSDVRGATFVLEGDSKNPGWNKQLLTAAGGDQKKLMEYLHAVICDETADPYARKAAAFFYGVNLCLDPSFNFNSDGVLKQLGKKEYGIDEVRFQQVLRDISGFDGLSDELVKYCTNGVQLMFDAGYYSVETKKGEFVVNTAFPYEKYVSKNKQVLQGESNTSLWIRRPSSFRLQPFPVNLKATVNVPGNLNIPSGQSYDFRSLYLDPYVSRLGGSIDQDNTNGKLTIVLPSSLNFTFPTSTGGLTSSYLDHTVSTTAGPMTVRNIIQNGDPSSSFVGSMLLEGKTIADVEAALNAGRVDLFLACLDPDSPLRRAFGVGDVTSKEYEMNLALADIYKMQANTYSANFGASVPVLKNADLFIFANRTTRDFTIKNEYPGVTPSPESQNAKTSTTTGALRLIGAISGIDVSLKPRVVPKYLLGASVSSTKVDSWFKAQGIEPSSWDVMFEAGTGLDFRTKEFGNRIKWGLEFGADALSSISVSKLEPKYNLQINPSVSFNLGTNKNRARFTVYSDIHMFDVQEGISMQKTMPNTGVGASASYEFISPNAGFFKGVELNFDIGTAPFKDKASNIFDNYNIGFGLNIRL
ncbi:MAG: hypothetical protein WC717_04365 [Candidatus Micrarchaeia archaeon]|jgi:hypothetical protein